MDIKEEIREEMTMSVNKQNQKIKQGVIQLKHKNQRKL